jgi:hypothetical protein
VVQNHDHLALGKVPLAEALEQSLDGALIVGQGLAGERG